MLFIECSLLEVREKCRQDVVPETFHGLRLAIETRAT